MKNWWREPGTLPIGQLVWCGGDNGLSKHGRLWVVIDYAGENYPGWYYCKSVATGFEYDFKRRSITPHEPITVTMVQHDQ